MSSSYALAAFADISRRLENIVRLGTIADVDIADSTAPRVRVRDGELLTDWLPFGALRAGTARLWSPPSLGEQVILLSPSGELGAAVVFGSLFCTASPAPSTSAHEHILEFPDGTRWAHNDATGASVFDGMKTVLIRASESLTIDTPHTTLTGHALVKGALTSQGGATIEGGLTNNSVNVGSTHQHSGVREGPSSTGAPA